ncbi:MAG: hypothetical protein SFY69_00100 [Planctomycetota bacterium]|nr:hypothetical protein [Planctomycetota bacterium]
MTRSALRWTLILSCLLVLGPLAMAALARVHDADGGRAATLLVNDTPGAALAGAALTIVAAGAVGLLGARFFSLNTGCLCAGLVVAWARWGLGTLDGLVRGESPGSVLPWLAIENVLAVAATVALALVMGRVAARYQPSVRPPGAAKPHAGGLLSSIVRGEGAPVPALVASGLVGMVALVLATWLVAATPLRGQTLMAAVAGTIACGAAAQLVASSMRCSLTPVTVGLFVLLAAGVSPLVASIMHGSRLVDAVFQGRVIGLALPLSLDWAAGALLGAPIGLSWGGAIVDARAAEE